MHQPQATGLPHSSVLCQTPFRVQGIGQTLPWGTRSVPICGVPPARSPRRPPVEPWYVRVWQCDPRSAACPRFPQQVALEPIMAASRHWVQGGREERGVSVLQYGLPAPHVTTRKMRPQTSSSTKEHQAT